MIERIIQDGRPISHVADEAGISRQRLTVWLRRYEMFGDAGLEDRSSRPARSPNQTSEDLEDRIEVLPEPGPRLTHDLIELPPDHPGQMSLDLDS